MTEKRRPGRPRKTEATEEPKKRRGRPRKEETQEAEAPKRSRRTKTAEAVSEGAGRKNAYFVSEEKGVAGFSSGCHLFDHALGGIGYARGRMVNIIGDKSTGKTLLAIEGMINFYHTVENPRLIYKECESAFDLDYAEALGLPIDEIEVEEDLDTVEDLYEDLERVMSESEKSGRETLYIVDSLDGLSDRSEMKRKIDEASYGGEKAKKLGEFFRKKIKALTRANVTLVIISQIRDNISAAAFGRKWKRSGGKALDFYASQIIYLANTGKITKTVNGKKRIVGVQIEALVDKNKVGNPHRSAAYPIIFGFGICDITAGVEWLQSNVGWDVLEPLGFKKTTYLRLCSKIRDGEHEISGKEMREKINALVTEHWQDIELQLMPKQSKY